MARRHRGAQPCMQMRKASPRRKNQQIMTYRFILVYSQVLSVSERPCALGSLVVVEFARCGQYDAEKELERQNRLHLVTRRGAMQ